ncbi:dihydropteroate synthase [Nitrospira tepida]|uniref:dihydropteroate synthase n=1 Tax=Nitrospira tepida TaxID=2973512 RepID=UPI00259CC288|nr:dihydropteroate synthase [Nitrospira tepida]
MITIDRPLLVGILNVTPDSFSDGGQFRSDDEAIAHALRMVEAGAAMLDIGAESSRPGAIPVTEEEETARLMPMLEKIARHCRVPISVDTTKAGVARRAIEAGASLINDISALRFDPAMGKLAAETGAGLVLMHMPGTPQTMQQQASYADVVHEVTAYLTERMAAAEAIGVKSEQIVLDPGFGFGKLVPHNLALLDRLPELCDLGRPLFVGLSRKSFIGQVTGRPVNEREFGTAAAVALAVERGASLLRVHDVAHMADAVKVVEAVMRQRAQK